MEELIKLFSIVGGNNTALVNLRQFIKDFKAELSMAVLDCNGAVRPVEHLDHLID